MSNKYKSIKLSKKHDASTAANGFASGVIFIVYDTAEKSGLHKTVEGDSE